MHFYNYLGQLPWTAVQPVPHEVTAATQLRLCELWQLLWLHHHAANVIIQK
jgi:methylglyoxal synthase